ncbi:MAG: HAMP domain-containing protein [Dorea formicigenerans]
MKFFYKIFLSMLLVLTVSLATIEYLTVSYSLEHALQREENTALSQHQMAKYSIQTVLLGITDDYTTSNMENIAKSAETPLGAQSGLFFASQNSQSGRDETVYYNSCKINPSDRIPATGILEYEIRETEKDRYLQVRSSFTLDTNSFVLVTEKNVEELFQDADTLRRRCEFFYWCILATGSFLVLVITFTLTKPLHRLQGTTRRFAKGEYDVRAEISSRDEIGDLSKTFNYMAKTIESKMEELKDAVRRQEEFTANFAHELKTPMTSIIGYADTLYQKTLSPEEVHQLAGIIMNEGMRLEALSFKLMELVTLRDYGRGIPKEDLQKITEAFYMVDKSRSREEHGAGLGLALAVKIAKLHHTELVYESVAGQGTCVSFMLAKEADDEEEEA